MVVKDTDKTKTYRAEPLGMGEAEETTSEKVEGLLEQMKQRADGLDLPISPAGQALIHREHLRKALQAPVHQYTAEVKRAKGGRVES